MDKIFHIDTPSGRSEWFRRAIIHGVAIGTIGQEPPADAIIDLIAARMDEWNEYQARAMRLVNAECFNFYFQALHRGYYVRKWGRKRPKHRRLNFG